jgi:predicted AAA+ superfamily ATPase
LTITGGLLVEGARGVGKTSTAQRLAASQIYLDSKPENKTIAEVSPELILEGAIPRLIDEWQIAPSLWNSVRREIDRRGKPGQFILTGSVAPVEDVARHTGAGRLSRLVMGTLSLQEKGMVVKKVDFRDLFRDKVRVKGIGGLKFGDYLVEMTRGGWPAILDLEEKKAFIYIRDYLDSIVQVDMRTLASPPEPIRMKALLRAISRNLATNATQKTLADDAGLIPETVRKYLDQLARIHILQPLSGWNIHLRSSASLRSSPKWHFLDPSVASASLGMGRKKLLGDLNTTGLFFESLVVRELRLFSQLMGGETFYYRDSSGLEVDVVVELASGEVAFFEVKLGDMNAIEEAIISLKKLKTKLTEQKQTDLKSLNVITAGDQSYTHPSGVNVIALSHLFLSEIGE